MALTPTALRKEIRERYLAQFVDFLKSKGEDVQIVGSSEIAIPVLDSEKNDEWLVINLKVPTGSRDGDIYDGYSIAEMYARHIEETKEKAKAKADAKAKKIARDKARREAKAKAKAEHEKGE